MTDLDLQNVNNVRRRLGKPLLTMEQAKRALAERGSAQGDGDEIMEFLIGYMTGIPYPSPAGIAGALLHQTGDVALADESPPVDVGLLGGGLSGGAGAQAAWAPSERSSASDPTPSIPLPEPSPSPSFDSGSSGGSDVGGGSPAGGE